MDFLMNIVTSLNHWLWDYLLIFLLCGTGIYFTVRLRFIQIRYFPRGIKQFLSCFSLHGKAADGQGMSPFQALATAIAAQVGTGNIAGAATALAAGGPGAIFWMWVSAFFGMATIYGEAILALKYKEKVDGHTVGGPAYYIRAAFQGKHKKIGQAFAAFFSVAIILALGFMGNMVQSSSIGDSFHTAFGIKPIWICFPVMIACVFVFFGGVKRIASVTEKVVPLMALFYIIGCVIILVMNRETLPESVRQIFVMAFRPQAVMGGAAGISVQKAMHYGVARGLFSNEAGMGSTPHAHAMAKVKDPAEQGVLAMIGVFIDTFIILTLTALVIISSGALETGRTAAPLAQEAFNRAFGPFGVTFIAICMLFFAFSTIVGWYFFGESNVRALFGKKAVPFYALSVAACIILGAFPKVGLVWDLSDLFNGLMVIPNLIGLLALSKVIIKSTKKH